MKIAAVKAEDEQSVELELANNYCKLKRRDGMVVHEKIINLGDLLDELAVYKATNFGLLPKDVRIIESLGNAMVIGIEFPRQSWDLKFGDSQTYKQVSLPAGIMLQKVLREGGDLKPINTHMFAIRGKRITFNSDRLYNFPTPNVYANGKVCWGNVNLGEFKHLSAMEGVLASFFNNRFNHDLFSGKVGPTYKGPTTAPEYFKHLTTNEFQEDWLIEYELPIGKIANKILKGN